MLDGEGDELVAQVAAFLGPKAPRHPRHGTCSEYKNHGCRCVLCRDAVARYERERYQARRATR